MFYLEMQICHANTLTALSHWCKPGLPRSNTTSSEGSAHTSRKGEEPPSGAPPASSAISGGVWWPLEAVPTASSCELSSSPEPMVPSTAHSALLFPETPKHGSGGQLSRCKGLIRFFNPLLYFNVLVQVALTKYYRLSGL